MGSSPVRFRIDMIRTQIVDYRDYLSWNKNVLLRIRIDRNQLRHLFGQISALHGFRSIRPGFAAEHPKSKDENAIRCKIPSTAVEVRCTAAHSVVVYLSEQLFQH